MRHCLARNTSYRFSGSNVRPEIQASPFSGRVQTSRHTERYLITYMYFPTWTYLAELQIVPERPVGPLTSGSNYVESWEGSMGECSCVYFKLKSPCAYVRVGDVENN